MKCPECGGRREVTRRFLWFFTVRRPCPRCTPRVRDDRWDDDSWRRTDDAMSLPPVSSPKAGRDRNDQFEAGSGGRSGGAGAGASWGDEAPLIVDPFPAEALPAEREAQSNDSGAEPESASSDEGASGSDAGTAY